jgi:transposase-like protein
MKKCPNCNSANIFTRTYNVTFKRAYNTSKIYEQIRIPKYVCAKCFREFDVERE